MEDASSLQKSKKPLNFTLLPDHSDKLAATILIKARELVTSSAIQLTEAFHKNVLDCKWH